MRYEVTIRARVEVEVIVEADSEEEALEKAWAVDISNDEWLGSMDGYELEARPCPDGQGEPPKEERSA